MNCRSILSPVLAKDRDDIYRIIGGSERITDLKDCFGCGDIPDIIDGFLSAKCLTIDYYNSILLFLLVRNVPNGSANTGVCRNRLIITGCLAEVSESGLFFNRLNYLPLYESVTESSTSFIYLTMGSSSYLPII